MCAARAALCSAHTYKFAYKMEMIELRTAVANQCVEFERKISTSIGERE